MSADASNLLPMLSEKEISEIEHEISHLPDRQSAAIDALRIVQSHRGWVSDESVSSIARLLGMSAAAVDGIATFYNLIFRQPVGRNVIMLCDSVSCFVMGASDIRAALIDQLGIQPGETTADDRFTLLPIVCLGNCDHAPTLLINEDLINDVKVEGLAKLLEAYS